MIEPLPIPYVRQPDVQHNRMCGAASLLMIYRYWAGERDASPRSPDGSAAPTPAQHALPSLSQRDLLECHLVWSRIATSDGRGGRYARCHRLAVDLHHAGLDAAVVQAAQPWQALQAAREAGLPTIVNFRLAPDSKLGHFAVVTAVATDAICLHDPQFGPHRRLSREQFLELWSSLPEGSEITGKTMIVVAGPTQVPPGPADRWPLQDCPGCGRAFAYPPVRPLLAAIAGAFCPWCDRGWQLRLVDEG